MSDKIEVKNYVILAVNNIDIKTIETRKRLTEGINTSNTINLQEEMYIFYIKKSATVERNKLSKTQKNAINSGREQIKNGQSCTNEEVNFVI